MKTRQSSERSRLKWEAAEEAADMMMNGVYKYDAINIVANKYGVIEDHLHYRVNSIISSMANNGKCKVSFRYA